MLSEYACIGKIESVNLVQSREMFELSVSSYLGYK